MSEAYFSTFCPVSLEPVKPMTSTSGWQHSFMPVVSPLPVRMFTTPSGSPADWRMRAKTRSVMELMEGGLMTQVLPTARAAEAFTASMMTGKFQGMIRAATPMGPRLK